MSGRKGTIEGADWAADSARSDELAATAPSPPAAHAHAAHAHAGRKAPVPGSTPPAPPSAGPPTTIPIQRLDRDALTAAGVEPSPATQPSPVAPRLRSVGKYQFIAALGRGGMADVHLAVAVGPAGFSKLQVIKRLRRNIAEEPEFQDMLLDEARLAARLNHRNVVQTNEVGLVDDEYFIAMEYLDGQPLSRILARAREQARAIPLAVSLWILSEALAGLHYAHELADYDGTPLNVVHRDVSPHNVFITYDGQVKVVDFGIALASRRVVETRDGSLKGKIAYMAPEQAFAPSSQIDRRADIFSVGVILWEMIAGRRLWRGLTDPQILTRLMQDVPDVRTARPDVPFELARICSQALARAPGHRHPTAAALRAELDRYAERLGEQVSAQQVGELVSALFAGERAEFRGTIDRQIKSLRERGVAPASAEVHGRSGALPSLVVHGAFDSGPPLAEGAVVHVTPPQGSTTPSRSNPPQGTLHAVVRPEPEPVQPPEPAPRPSRTPLLAGGAAVAALGSVLVLVYLMVVRLRDPAEPGARPPAPPAHSAPLVQGPPPTAAPAPAAEESEPRGAEGRPGLLRASIKASPAGAKIFVDGSELPTNPFEGKLIKDGAAHRIEISAPGHVTQRRMLVFDGDIALDVTLVAAPRKPAAGAAPAASTAPAAERPPAPAASAAPAEAPPGSPADPPPGLPPPKPDPY